MPSAAGELLRQVDSNLPNYASTETDRLFELLRREFRFGHAYLTDIVKGGPAKVREPSQEELDAFSGFFEHELHTLNPRLVVALGRDAEKQLRRLVPQPGAIVEYLPHPAWVTRPRNLAERLRRLNRLIEEFRRVRAVADRLGLAPDP